MFNDLATYVLWIELMGISGKNAEYAYSTKELETIRLGKNLYLRKDSIPDILLRVEAEHCLNLSLNIPVSVLSNILAMTEYEERLIRRSNNVFSHYGVAFFSLPEKIIDLRRLHKNVIINHLQREDTDDGYDIVVEISNNYRLGAYSL